MSTERLRSFKTHKLANILVVGIAVRLILMPITAHPFDMYVWYNISESILQHGPLFLQGFPPLWYHYMMVPVAYSYSSLSGFLPNSTIAMSTIPAALDFYPSYSIPVVPGLLFDFVVKIPFLISDILVAFLLYKLVSNIAGSQRLGELAALFWFLNPFVIWISAGWGMWDTLPALFSLAALYFLVKRRFGFSAVCLSLGVALKVYPILFLVPIAFYLYRVSSVGERWRKLGQFFGVFAGFSLLLFLPYLCAVSNFASDFFLLGSDGGIGAVTPLGPFSFGLTYWSTLSALVNMPAAESVVLFVSVASLVMLLASLALVYWRSSKLHFEKPLFDLSVVLLLSVVALFLSYRIVSEQWIIWILPFMVILSVSGRIGRALYWGISLAALLYAVLNCPLPFFFLPLVPWASGTLVGMVHFIWWVEPLRVVGLTVLGCVFSVLLAFAVWRSNRKMR